MATAPTILVVDDDPNIREQMRIHLGGAGYRVQLAEDGIAAGYAVLRGRPDLIISDVNMPYMDGLEFVAALRADNTVADIPVVLLTSQDELDYRAKALGAAGYVTKPILADVLLEVVAKAIARTALSPNGSNGSRLSDR